MHESESRELVTCAACSGVFDPSENVYGFGTRSALCFECATERGGTWDADAEQWSQGPDISGLADSES